MLEGKQRKGAAGRGAQQAVGERSAEPGGRADASTSDPELRERATRRRFSAEYKRRIVNEAATCSTPGAIGALLRREGLYSSHLTSWRQQLEHSAAAAFRGKRGPKPNALAAEIAQLRRRAERAEAELVKARKVIEVQGKVSALLGIMLESNNARLDETDETPRTPDSRTSRFTR